MPPTAWPRHCRAWRARRSRYRAVCARCAVAPSMATSLSGDRQNLRENRCIALALLPRPRDRFPKIAISLDKTVVSARAREQKIKSMEQCLSQNPGKHGTFLRIAPSLLPRQFVGFPKIMVSLGKTPLFLLCAFEQRMATCGGNSSHPSSGVATPELFRTLFEHTRTQL